MPLTPAEREHLATFVLFAYPTHAATSALLALDQDSPVTPDLIERVGHPDGQAWLALLPALTGGSIAAAALSALRWHAPFYPPAFMRDLVLGRELPIDSETVGTLDRITYHAVGRVSEMLKQLAQRQLAAMARAASAYGDGAEVSTATWTLAGLQHICQQNIHRANAGVSRGYVRWIAHAVTTGAVTAWSDEEVTRTLDLLLDPDLASAVDVTPVLGSLIARLDMATTLDLLRRASRGDDCPMPTVRRLTLEHVRTSSQDLPADAGRYKKTWMDERRRSPERLERGTLGIPVDDRQPLRDIPTSDEEIALLRDAGGDDIETWTAAICAGVPLGDLRPFIGPERIERFVARLVHLFEHGECRSEPYDHLHPHVAAALALLGTDAAFRCLRDGLSRPDPIGLVCEAALARAGGSGLGLLLTATESRDAAVALPATRALASTRDERARARLTVLATGGCGLVRWVALRGLSLLEERAPTLYLLRSMYAAAPGEERAFLLTLCADCARDPDDLAWTTSLVDDPVVSEALLRCLRQLIVLAMADRAGSFDAEIQAAVRRIAAILAKQPTLARALSTDEWRRLAAGTRHAATPELRQRLLELVGRTSDELTVADMAYVQRTSHDAALDVRGNTSDIAYAKELSAPPPKVPIAACFSVLAPSSIAPNQDFLVEVYCHRKELRDEILGWSSNKMPRRFTTGPRRVRAGNLVVDLQIAGIGVSEPTGGLWWDGDLGSLQFPCRAPLAPDRTTYPGSATFLVAGVPVATTHFVLTIGPIAGRRSDVATQAEIVRRAFASYASVDRSEVLARIQGMQKVAPFLDIFTDVLSLRSGDDWRQVIHREIIERDALFLFWSRAARASSHVDYEWRTALTERGLEHISPVPIEAADVAPPPDELQSLHFHDWTLSVK